MQPDLEKLKQAFEASTQGEWKTGVTQAVNVSKGVFIEFGDNHWTTLDSKPDMEFIALAHNEMPSLLEMIAKLQSENEHLGGYAAFLRSCALSGEQPESFEWYLAETAEHKSQK